MHPHRLQQLVASVPESVAGAERARLDAHVRTSEGCRELAARVRTELDGALTDPATAEQALDLAVRLDGLERVQQRLDGWLTELVEQLTSAPGQVHYDDGVPV